jgi:hypothetical protein
MSVANLLPAMAKPNGSAYELSKESTSATSVFIYLFIYSRFIYQLTERRGREVNTPASYSEVPGSSLRPETGFPDQDFLWVSSVPPVKFRDIALNSGNDYFLPNCFQFIIHLSSFHSLWVTE